MDLGTEVCKASAFTLDGRLVHRVSFEQKTYYPNAGWAEQDPEEWWHNVSRALKCLTRRVGRERISGVGISGQMEGPTLLDRYGDQLRSCIIWADMRGEPYCRMIIEKLGEYSVYLITGLRVNPMHTLAKLLWIKYSQPKIFDRATAMLLPKDYVRYRLTGEIATEYSDASSTLMLDINRLRWSEEIVDTMGIPVSILPPLSASHEIVGEVTKVSSEETGLSPGTAVVAGGADTGCSYLGLGVLRSGDLGLYQGSSASVYACSPFFRKDRNMMTITRCHVAPRTLMTGGGLSTAGSLMTWAREMLREKDFYEMDREAAAIPAGSEGLIVLPYFMGARSPFWKPNLRGGFYGLTPRHGRAHLIRAIMEGVAYGLRDIVETVNMQSVEFKRLIAGGGCLKSEAWSKITSGVLGRKMKVVETEAPETLGAALLAGFGVQLLRDLKPPQGLLRTKVVVPEKSEKALYEKEYKRYRKLISTIIETEGIVEP